MASLRKVHRDHQVKEVAKDMFENLDWNSIAYGAVMFGLGAVVASVIQYRRVTLFIERLQEQLAHVGNYKVRLSVWYRLRVMLFGIPKNKAR